MEPSGTFVGGGDSSPNAAVVHEGEASFPNPDSGSTTGFSKILQVDVVMGELLRYFSVEDMKVLSRTSKDALNAVRKSKVFSKRAAFRICNDSLRSRVLDNCLHSWKTVKVDVYVMDDGVVDYVPPSSTIEQLLDSVQSLSVKLEPDYSSAFKDSVVCSKISGFVLEIIERSKEALEELALDYNEGTEVKGITSILVPNLKRLKFISYHYDDNKNDAFKRLLRNLPPLEEITVDGLGPLYLISGLHGRMAKLRKLDFGIEGLSFDYSTPPRAVDWNLFADMTKLEDLSITLHSDYYRVADVEEILRIIPAGSVTNLFVGGYDTVRSDCFSQEIGEHISRFANLTKLRLHDLKHLDDDGIQRVIKSCPKLKNLSLECLRGVTDFAVSGVRNSPTDDDGRQVERGASLTDLKDLTALTVTGHGITCAALSDVIRFELLTSLTVHIWMDQNWKTERARDFLIQLIRQNPRLNDIDLWIQTTWDYYCRRDNELEVEAKRFWPRIRRLKFEYNVDQQGNWWSSED